jgi:hypothetical protein
VYGYGESLHEAHNLLSRLLSETFSSGTQGLASPFLQPISILHNIYIGVIVLILELPTT